MSVPPILVAGVGNVLRGDDGFGVAVARALTGRRLADSVQVVETGIGGMGLVHELLAPRAALVMIDAFRRGGAPGSVYVLEPDVPDIAGLDAHAQRAFLADTHYATPVRALAFAAALGKLPRVVRIIGCEPEDAERFEAKLSAAVERAVGRAVDLTIELVHKLAADLARADAPS